MARPSTSTGFGSSPFFRSWASFRAARLRRSATAVSKFFLRNLSISAP